MNVRICRGQAWSLVTVLAVNTAFPRKRAHYDRRRDVGDRHAAAQRNLFGRLLGCLHHCLTTRQHYNENTAFPNTSGKIPDAA